MEKVFPEIILHETWTPSGSDERRRCAGTRWRHSSRMPVAFTGSIREILEPLSRLTLPRSPRHQEHFLVVTGRPSGLRLFLKEQHTRPGMLTQRGGGVRRKYTRSGSTGQYHETGACSLRYCARPHPGFWHGIREQLRFRRVINERLWNGGCRPGRTDEE